MRRLKHWWQRLAHGWRRPAAARGYAVAARPLRIAFTPCTANEGLAGGARQQRAMRVTFAGGHAAR